MSKGCFGIILEFFRVTKLKVKFSHKQLVLVSDPCFNRGFLRAVGKGKMEWIRIIFTRIFPLFLK